MFPSVQNHIQSSCYRGGWQNILCASLISKNSNSQCSALSKIALVAAANIIIIIIIIIISSTLGKIIVVAAANVIIIIIIIIIIDIFGTAEDSNCNKSKYNIYIYIYLRHWGR